MITYRIIQLAHGAGRSGDARIEFVIEKRAGFIFKSWKEVMREENGEHRRIEHESYEVAEKYLMDNYTTGCGIGSMVTRSGNVYYVEPYTLNYC